MIGEEERALFNYTFPCTLGNEIEFRILMQTGRFRESIDGDRSRTAVRRYFIVDHNAKEIKTAQMNCRLAALAYLHLALPYGIIKFGNEKPDHKLVCEIVPPFDKYSEREKIFRNHEVSSAKERGVLKPDLGIVVAHAGIIVDSCSREEIAQYIEEFKQKMAA